MLTLLSAGSGYSWPFHVFRSAGNIFIIDVDNTPHSSPLSGSPVRQVPLSLLLDPRPSQEDRVRHALRLWPEAPRPDRREGLRGVRQAGVRQPGRDPAGFSELPLEHSSSYCHYTVSQEPSRARRTVV